MANSFELVSKITKHALPVFTESRAIAGRVNNDKNLISEQVDSSGGGKTGGTIKIRLPKEFTVRTGAARSEQDLVDQYTSVPAPELVGIDFTITDIEKSKDFTYVAKEIVQPAVQRLATEVDLRITKNYWKIPNVIGKAGTHLNEFQRVAEAEERLFMHNCPADGNVHFVMNSADQVGLSNHMKGLYAADLSVDAVRRGELGRLASFNMHRSSNLYTHTTGAFSTGSTPLVSASVSNGAKTISTDGWAASTAVLKKGDVFSIAGVNQVNPHTKQSTGVLKNFVSLTDVTSNGSGQATITVVESDESIGINYSGQYKNASAQILDNAAITVWGTGLGMIAAASESTEYQQSIAFHKNAFWSGFFPLSEATSGAVSSVQTDSETGVSIRVIEQYDIDNAKTKYRMDVFHTSDVLMKDHAVRLIGKA